MSDMTREDPVSPDERIRRAIYSVWPGLGQDDARRVVDAMRPLLAASPADGAGSGEGLEGADRLAFDLARADSAMLALVAEWMLDHGWTEPL